MRSMRSCSTARLSASGVSGMVSRLEMLGDLLRADVGVLGMELDSEMELRENGRSDGKDSLNRPDGGCGDAGTLDARLELRERRGECGRRRRGRGNVRLA